MFFRVRTRLKTLEFQESGFKALKVLEIGFWSLKVIDFLSEQDHKISSFRVVSANVHANSVQTSCNVSEMRNHSFFFSLVPYTSAPRRSLLCTCFHALVLRSP